MIELHNIQSFTQVPAKFTGIVHFNNGCDGCDVYMLNGERHRENGPAIVWNSNHDCDIWVYEDKIHRLDGPAKMDYEGHAEYYVHGTKTTKQAMKLYASLLKLKNI